MGDVKASDFSDAPDDEVMPLVTKQYHPEVAVLADYMQSRMEAQGHMWFYTRAGHDILSKLGHVFHKAAIDKIFPAIPAGPSKFPDFKNGEEFTPEQRIQMDKHKDAVAHYLVDIGHEDWAMAIPGMSSKKIIELVK